MKIAQLNPAQPKLEKQADFQTQIKGLAPGGGIGEPQALGGIALYLVSESLAWVIGRIFAADGGVSGH